MGLRADIAVCKYCTKSNYSDDIKYIPQGEHLYEDLI